MGFNSAFKGLTDYSSLETKRDDVQRDYHHIHCLYQPIISTQCRRCRFQDADK